MEIAKLLAPVWGERPCGEDVRYDPLFEELQAEVEKLGAPSVAGGVDWDAVVGRAGELLAHRSKDLVVASYLAVALIHTRKSEGILAALELYQGILEAFWEGLYPPCGKERARRLAIEWWLEKSLRALHEAQVRLDPVQRGTALETLERIEQFLLRHLPEPPSVERLRRCLGEEGAEEGALEVTESRAEPEGEPPRAETHAAAESEGARSQLSTVPAEGDLEGALQRVWQCALLLRQDDPAAPLPYRVVRHAAWGGVSALPPALEGRTRIAPPERHHTALLRELRRKGAAARLVEGAETRLPHYIFWLDLNRLSFEALGDLGESFAVAQETIVQETRHLLARLPGLDALSFSDGTPFADAETRRWLRSASPLPPRPQLDIADLDPSTEHSDVAAAGGANRLPEVLAQARLLAREGKLPDGVAVLNDNLQGVRAGRERLLWRLALVEFLLNAGAARSALPQIEQVLVEVDRHGLELYDPAVALPALKLAYAGLRLQEEPVFREKALKALFRIGRLDPAEMVRLEQGVQ